MRSEDIRYFLAIVSVGKLSSVSDLLGITQPGLTKAVSRLEEELGGTLFRRSGRGMDLTELGIAFEKRARRMTAEIDHAMADARALNPRQGLIRLGISPVLESMVVDLIARYVRTRPLVRFELMVQITDYLEIALSGGRLDVAATWETNLFTEELAFQPLAYSEVRIAATTDHPLASQPGPLHLRDLVPYEWALPAQDLIQRRAFIESFTAQGLPEPKVRIGCDNYGLMLYNLASRCGLLTLYAPFTHKYITPHGAFKLLDVADFGWKHRVGLLTRRGFPLSPVTMDFVNSLTETQHPDMLF